MIQVPLHDAEGREVGAVEVDETVFGSRVHRRLLRQVVVLSEANHRVGTASTLRRSEVSGSGRKPWKQKHTGRARVGDRGTPLWRHGGSIFGPKPRDYHTRIPRKMRALALNSAILGKLKDGEIKVIEGLSPAEPKTKPAAAVLRTMGVLQSCLVGPAANDRNLYLSMRNLPGVAVAPVDQWNTRDVLLRRWIVLTRDGLTALLRARNVQAGVAS